MRMSRISSFKGKEVNLLSKKTKKKPKRQKWVQFKSYLAPLPDIMMQDLLTPFWQSFAVSLLLAMPEEDRPCNGLK